MKVRGASQTAFQKVRMKIRGAAQPAAKAKAKVKKCSKPRCRNNAASLRAKFCIGCFKANARCTGAKTGGNSGAKGVIGNSGNTNSGQQKKFAGKRSALRRSTKMLLAVKNPWLLVPLIKDKRAHVVFLEAAKRASGDTKRARTLQVAPTDQELEEYHARAVDSSAVD